MKKKLFTIFVVLISLTSFAEEPQLFVSNNLAVYIKNFKTNQFDLVKKVEKYNSIVYGKDYVQISNNPDLKYVLYGDATKVEDADNYYYHRRGYTNTGEAMVTTTIYGKKSKYIKVAFYLKDAAAIYDIVIKDE